MTGVVEKVGEVGLGPGGRHGGHACQRNETRSVADCREADQWGRSPLLARLDPAQGSRLAALPYELVWATTWEADANAWVAPRLGLPELPVLPWTDGPGAPGLHWKTPALVAWAEGRPFAWVDDEIGPADRAWVAAHHAGPALLHRVDARRGLVAADFAALTAWVR
ncbi:hypothetical protein [Streptomyces sp. NPDC059491]|uniref:hypothetical protein n=1 Tax=Streptomyces sp. NPDC059491 TaxID=3346850 RepID=UPI00368EF230